MNESRFNALQSVQRYAFAMIDAQLYLDAYPDNSEALEYYNKMKQKHETAVIEYERAYGPLTAQSALTEEDVWRWSEGPWPWQIGEGCNVCGRM